MSNSSDVGRYYDANHRSFLRFGVGRRAGVIHRAVWGQGVESRLQALHYVHDLVLAELDELGGAETARVLDLGCGAGASLRYLAERGLGSGVGISNSASQIEAANRAFRRDASASGPRLDFLKGDFVDPRFLGGLDFTSDEFDLVYAIESFAHISSPPEFFDTAVRFLRPRGRLVLIDDLLVTETQRKRRPVASSTRARGARQLAEFESGWNLAPLRSARQVRTLARKVGLEAVREIDLTPWLERGTLRDRMVRFTVATLRPLATRWQRLERSARWSNLVGGHALQRLLAAGLVEYRCMVFTRTGPNRLEVAPSAQFAALDSTSEARSSVAGNLLSRES
jgi:SAM-dependent methyltransferase